VGEGEECISTLAGQVEGNAVDAASVPGLGYRTGDGHCRVNPPFLEMDLARLGMPAWDLMPPRDYSHKQSLHALATGRVIAPISVSRGCPYLCTFCTCHTIMGRTVRHRPVELVLDEIEMLVQDHGVDEVHIIDDHFTRDPEYVLAFCRGIADRELRIKWACPYGVRIDSIEADLVRTMEQAGCYLISLGIESASQRILDLVKKRVTPELVEEKVTLLRQHTSMILQGFFMIGFPTETEQEIMDTIEFARRLPLHLVGFNTLRLTPGAEILSLVEEEGWTDIDWEAIDVEHVYYHPKTVSRERLTQLRSLAYRRFFLTPGRIRFLAKQLTSLRNIRIFLRLSLRRWFGGKEG
jgi:radical SAM superfamily enzyme YgiQ (UPF0313 family)